MLGSRTGLLEKEEERSRNRGAMIREGTEGQRRIGNRRGRREGASV